MEKHIRKSAMCGLAFFCCVLLAFAAVVAQVPRTMSYQGVLTDAGGVPVPDGNYSITFKLYDAAAGGAALWTEEQLVTVSKGVFSTVLGSVNPLFLSFSRQYWLGVVVGGGAEMTPRIQLASSAYSLRAVNADSLNGLSAGVTPAPNRIIPLGADGKFPSSVFPSGQPLNGTAEGDITAVYAGIGLAGGGESGDVTLAVHVPLTLSGVTGTVDAIISGTNTGDGRGVYGESAGGTGVRGKSGSANGVYGSSIGGSGVRGESNGNDGVYGQSGTGAGVRGRSSSGHAGYFEGKGYFSGNVGIGLTNPQRLLHLSNPNNVSIVLEDSGAAADQRKKFINSDDGLLRFGKFSDSWGFIPQMTISNDGKVGIETTNPVEKLHVAGTIYSSTGGFKFPDGTVQSTSAILGGGDISAVHAGSGLSGGGESGDVTLAVHVPLSLSGNISGVTNSVISGANSSDGQGVYGESAGGMGVRGISGSANGVYGTSNTGYGVRGDHTGSGNYGYLGSSQYGVYGFSDQGHAVHGESYRNIGVYGSSYSGDAVVGIGDSYYGYGVRGEGYIGVYAFSPNDCALYACSNSGRAVFGYSNGNGGYIGASEYGVYGFQYNGGDYAGLFDGNVRVNGTLTKTAGSFKIDHPLDPANKYLQHSFVESPDMMNIYNGIVILDSNGETIVELPYYFQTLNKDFRYQLTAIGSPAPNLHITEKISGNRFKIAGGSSGMEVSWQVTGIRQDPYAQAHRIEVEKEKTGKERGKYLHPREYGMPESMGLNYEETQRMERELKANEEKMNAIQKTTKRVEEQRP